MGVKKSAEEYFRLAKNRGSENVTQGINAEIVHKGLDAQGQRPLDRILNLWTGYKMKHPDADVRDLKSLKEFMKDVAMGIQGEEADPDLDMDSELEEHAAEETVIQYWKDFTRAYYRENNPFDKEITNSVRKYIQTDLQAVWPMPKRKRPRRFGTKAHFRHLGRQMWGLDWYSYDKPARRVYDWAALTANVSSSSRIGENYESSCRRGSKRGLYYKDVQFVVFRNEYGNSELAFQLVRDAKGTKDIPQERPKHAIYEGKDPGLLLENGLLFHLAIFISQKAFRNCATIENILAKEPNEGEDITVIPWADDMLDKPLYPSMSRGGIETANAASKRLRDLGFRAGYARPPTMHDFRAENLAAVGKYHTEAERRKHAGHRDTGVYDRHYASHLAADGQGAYFNGEIRRHVLDLFRDLTIPRNPFLWQALPAREREEFERKSEVIEFRTELASLSGHTDTQQRRKFLLQKLRNLKRKELRTWRKTQRRRTEDEVFPSYHQCLFDRIRYLMPERSRVAKSLFQVASLRDPVAIGALRDLIALCQSEDEVTCRPGLEANKCRCGRAIVDNDWRHVHDCHKATNNVVSNFCWLCHKWYYGEPEWKTHCQWHLETPEAIPLQCDPLMFGGVLAAPGLCSRCLGDERLPADIRMRQFYHSNSWRVHNRDCLQKRQGKGEYHKGAKCTHQRCSNLPSFESIRELSFHDQDVHGTRFAAKVGPKKRGREGDNLEVWESGKRRRTHTLKERQTTADESIKNEYTFIDVTDTFALRERSVFPPLRKKSSLESDIISERVSPAETSNTDTPLSFVCTENIAGSTGDKVSSREGILSETPIRAPSSDQLRLIDEPSAQKNLPQDILCQRNLSDDDLAPLIDPELDRSREINRMPNITTKDADRESTTRSRPEPDQSHTGGPASKPKSRKCIGAKKNKVTGVSTRKSKSKGRKTQLGFEIELLLGEWRSFYLVKWKGFSEDQSTWEPRRHITSDALEKFYETFTGNDRAIEALLGERVRGGIKEYLVKWKCDPVGNNTWEAESTISQRRIEEFMVKR